MYRKFFKRLLDFFGALIALILTAPLMVFVFLLIYVNMGNPVLFRQKRAGFQGKSFILYKFRTMTNQRNKDGRLLSDRERLTIVGQILRKLSIDELPQLVNVLKGDMSLVGPRPLLVEYLSVYNEYHARRHEVKPGITGWAQVNGRQDNLFSKRCNLDVWYVDHISFLLDIKIMWRTMGVVMSGSGVRTGQEITTVDDLGLTLSLRHYPQ